MYTMWNFTATTASLLCIFFWISVSAFESQTLEVQPGQDVTLLCSNFSSIPTQILWFRVVKGNPPRCISHMFEAYKPAELCSGFTQGKFEMKSNMSMLSLKIKQVNVSDTGLYFCGYYLSRNPVICDATSLEVQEDDMKNQTTLIRVGLVVFLTIIVMCLAVEIKNLLKAHINKQDHQQDETLAKAERNHRPASDRDMEPDAVYSSP